MLLDLRFAVMRCVGFEICCNGLCLDLRFAVMGCVGFEMLLDLR
jgi:hypothetical protein